jgi:hypothetical protein
MDREAIIREWFYRLPKGYAEVPYTKAEMNILHEILEENGLNGSVFVNETVDPGPKRNFKPYGDKYTEYEKATNKDLKEVDQLDQAFHDAKPVEDLDEAEEEVKSRSNAWFAFEDLQYGDTVGRWKGKSNKDLAEALINVSRINGKEEWDKFITALPSIKSVEKVKDEVYDMHGQEIKDFVAGLSSIDDKDALAKETPDKATGIEKIIFDMEPAGVGRGELWLAWKVKGFEQIQGGTASYDVEMTLSKIKGKNFEVKAYHSPKNTKKPFRLGTHGILGRFDFWKNIFDTAVLIEKLKDFVTDEDKGMAELGKLITYHNKTKLKLAISKGEIGAARINKLLDFYETANKYATTIDKPNTYDIIQIKSSLPGNPSKYYSIDPSKLEDVLGGKVIISKENELKDEMVKTRMTQKLLADPYVNNPQQLTDDINAAIQEVTDNYQSELQAGFLVFREDGIRFSEKAELQKVTNLRTDMSEPKNIITLSMGRLYVKELTGEEK